MFYLYFENLITPKEGYSIGLIQVIDAPCGSGKTSWAVQEFNAHTDRSYIYVTPFLDEISRVRRQCGFERFQEPQPYGRSKIESFNNLLTEGKDIAVTHVTFLNATSETLELIRDGDYTLVVDEALDVIQFFNDLQSVERTPKQVVSAEDIEFLLKTGVIQIEKNKVFWIGGEYSDDMKFSEVQRFAKLGRLYCVNGQLLLAIFPPEMFQCFKEIYVLTYYLQSVPLFYYFQMFSLDYELKSVVKDADRYKITDYDSSIDAAFRTRCKDLITICDNKRLNAYKSNTLSRRWYDKNNKGDDMKVLKANLRYFYHDYLCGRAKASNGDIMWTTFQGAENKLSGSGYTRARSLTKEEMGMPEADVKKLDSQLKCFVPCNAKATNIYKERWALAYMINFNMNPFLEHFFLDGNEEREAKGKPGIYPDKDKYSVGALIQWIFRSRIRDNMPIEIYIPSQRMRTLLQRWMNNEI